MRNGEIKKKLIVVADDFTGATDTGVQFRKAGLKVNVILDTNSLQQDMKDSDVLVVDLESRFDTKEVAYRKCFELGRKLLKLGSVNVYKKLDSTFRGNIGGEIDGLMDSMKVRVALLAPALPAYGRTTENGEVFVHGVRLAETEVSNDPRTPVKNSRIGEIIGQQSSRTCREVTIKALMESTPETGQLLSHEFDKGSEILIFDSTNENDLENVAKFIKNINDFPILISGSAGLANHLRDLFFESRDTLSFIFSGSVGEKSRKQMNHAIDQGRCELYFIDGKDILNNKFATDRIINSVSSDIKKGKRRFIFTSALTNEDIKKVFNLARQSGISKDAAAEKIALAIGRLAGILIETFQPTGTLLTGGDIAFKTIQALNATGINIEQEIFPGIPSGRLTGCKIRSTIVTKAGGFGSNDIISKTLDFFNKQI